MQEKIAIHARSTISSDLAFISTWIKSENELLMWSGKGFSFPVKNEELFNLLLMPGKRFFTFIENSFIIGYGEIGRIEPQNESAFLSRIIVAPQKRGFGLGKIITGFLIQYCFKILDRNTLYLNVFLNNKFAMAIYEQEGFSFIEGSEYIVHTNNQVITGKRMKLLKTKS